MKAFLMYRDQDFDLQQPLPAHAPALTQDLELNALFNTMANGDKFLFDVAQKAIFQALNDPDAVRYRQDILKDCLKNPSIIREIYRIPIEALENKRKQWLGLFGSTPWGILYGAVEMLEMFAILLRKLRQIADEYAGQFESEGFRRFFSMLKKELDDEYFASVEEHLRELKFRDGILLSASLGSGNEGTDYVLRKPGNPQGWMKRVFSQKSPVYSFRIPPRDDAGARAIENLKNRGINLVANALAQSSDHINSFFDLLRAELAFYIGCLNLSEQLSQLDEPIAFPQPLPVAERRHACAGLYDICLALTMKRKIVGNTLDADHKELVLITGANQGGKSTFLRSIGLAQLMLQAGLFVPAESFSANLCTGIFTHYKRKEDASMKSGKLDEELSRMSEIVDQITPNSLMLFNESFAATNEREGSEIARQIINALLERGIKVFFVTHLYDLAHSFYEQQMTNAIFLRAERKGGGKRTYKLFEGEPMQTSHGQDLYHKVFEAGQ